MTNIRLIGAVVAVVGLIGMPILLTLCALHGMRNATMADDQVVTFFVLLGLAVELGLTAFLCKDVVQLPGAIGTRVSLALNGAAAVCMAGVMPFFFQ